MRARLEDEDKGVRQAAVKAVEQFAESGDALDKTCRVPMSARCGGPSLGSTRLEE